MRDEPTPPTRPPPANGAAVAELSSPPAVGSVDRNGRLSAITGAAAGTTVPAEDRGDVSILVLHQRFRYDYATPVRHLRHRLVIVPRAVHGRQRRLDHSLTVTGAAALTSVGTDSFGNHVVDVRATAVDEAIEFEAWALVWRPAGERIGVTTLAPSLVGDPRLLAPTPLTQAAGFLAAVAQELRAAPTPVGCPEALALAERICAWSHRSLTYAHDVTTVRTSAIEAVAAGRGVCQDFAHVMLALCRAARLPARYVSGHLVGEGGSHAWVEVVVADATRRGRAEAVAFDPTHDRRAGSGYLTVAVGRDYADVAPTSGTFEGGGPGVLTTRKHLRLVPADG